MKRLQIARTRFGPSSTLSVVSSPDRALRDFYGLERAWKENAAGVSCIPTGIYTLVPWRSPARGFVYTFVGGSVSPFAGTADRLYCHFHKGNRPSELQGCLAPGEDWKRRGVDYNVFPSKPAFDRFMTWAAGEPVFTRIIHRP